MQKETKGRKLPKNWIIGQYENNRDLTEEMKEKMTEYLLSLHGIKENSQNKDNTANIQFILYLSTSALLFYTAYLVSTAHPIYIQGTIGPYWNRCFFQDLDNSIIYTQLTITTFAFLGITQIIAAKTQQKTAYSTEHPKLNKIFATLQTLSGIIFYLCTKKSTKSEQTMAKTY